MAATAHIVRTTQLQAREINGAVVRLVMQARVTGLSDTDQEVLTTALATSGVPAAGATLSGYDNLILVERNPRLVDGDPTTVDIDLIYETYANDGQNLSSPPAGVAIGEARVNVSQVRTNLDQTGTAITVEHRYPGTDPNWPGQRKEQGGEIDVYVPQRTMRVQGRRTVPSPWLLAGAIVGKVNNAAWAGGEARSWMCTGMYWELFDRGTNRYTVNFEFQHNPDTWDPTAVYIDEKTQKPPVNLVVGEGIKTIQWHGAVNFEGVIGARVQGA